jgi:hypothetical protein
LAPCDEISGHTHVVFRFVTQRRNRRTGVSKLTVSELYDQLQEPQSRIRNDLEELEALGLLERHGDHLICRRWCGCKSNHPDLGRLLHTPGFEEQKRNPTELEAFKLRRSPAKHVSRRKAPDGSASLADSKKSFQTEFEKLQNPRSEHLSRPRNSYKPLAKWNASDLAKYFNNETVWRLGRLPSPLVPLASAIKRDLLDPGVTREEVRMMIRIFCETGDEMSDYRQPWKMFIAQRQALLFKARQRLEAKRAHKEASNPDYFTGISGGGKYVPAKRRSAGTTQRREAFAWASTKEK